MSSTLQDDRPTARPRRRFGFLLRPGWIGAIVGALAFTAACWLILAPWQFSRSAENSSANHLIDAALNSTPVPVRQYLSTDQQPETSATYQKVTATGVFDSTHVYYVRLRQDSQGNPVSEVVLPMRLTDGSILLVDRGYRSFGDMSAGVPLPPAPTGVVTVVGRVQQDQTDPAHRQPKFVDNLNQAWAVNADALAGMDGTIGSDGNVLQGYIQLVAGSPGVLDEIGMPQTDVGPYFSYALQWCAFGGMSILAIAYFIFREATDPRGPDERNVAYPGRSRYPDEIAPPADELAPQRDGPQRDGPQRDGPQRDGPQPAEMHAAAPRSADAVDNAAVAFVTPPFASPTGPVAGTPASKKPKKKRPSRDGFDRSQLYD